MLRHFRIEYMQAYHAFVTVALKMKVAGEDTGIAGA